MSEHNPRFPSRILCCFAFECSRSLSLTCWCWCCCVPAEKLTRVWSSGQRTQHEGLKIYENALSRTLPTLSPLLPVRSSAGCALPRPQVSVRAMFVNTLSTSNEGARGREEQHQCHTLIGCDFPRFPARANRHPYIDRKKTEHHTWSVPWSVPQTNAHPKATTPPSEYAARTIVVTLNLDIYTAVLSKTCVMQA